MNAATAPIIGIRDSGVGGLTVARRIRRLLPGATLLYFADTAHVPYGERAPDEVRHYALSISQFLLDEGAELLVFACNTSSAYALELARSRFAAPVVGMIEPGARAAVAQRSRGRAPIGVLATQATVDSGVYTACLGGIDAQATCIEVACPEFVPLVESGETAGEPARRAAAAYLQPLLAAGAETIILGCTHYPLLLPVLQEAAPGARFIDPAVAVAEEVEALVRKRFPATSVSETVGTSRFFVSGPDGGVRDWIAELMELSEIEICPGPVFDLCTPVR